MFSCVMALGIHRSLLRRHIKEVVLIAHGAVLHHSLLVIYWSNYLRGSLSKDISALIYLPFRPAALYLFGSWADPAARLWKRWALSLHLKRPYRTPSTPNIHLPAEPRSRCDVACWCATERAGDCVHSQVAASFFSEVSLGPGLELWSARFRFGFFRLFQAEFQALPVVFAGTHNRAWVTAGMERRQSQN